MGKSYLIKVQKYGERELKVVRLFKRRQVAAILIDGKYCQLITRDLPVRHTEREAQIDLNVFAQKHSLVEKIETAAQEVTHG